MPGTGFTSLPREVLDQIAEEIVADAQTLAYVEFNRFGVLRDMWAFNPLEYRLIHPDFRESVERAFWESTTFHLTIGQNYTLTEWYDIYFESRAAGSRLVMSPDMQQTQLHRIRILHMNLTPFRQLVETAERYSIGVGVRRGLLARFTGLQQLEVSFTWNNTFIPDDLLDLYARVLVARVPSLRSFRVDVQLNHIRPQLSERESRGVESLTRLVREEIERRETPALGRRINDV